MCLNVHFEDGEDVLFDDEVAVTNLTELVHGDGQYFIVVDKIAALLRRQVLYYSNNTSVALLSDVLYGMNSTW